MANEETAGDTLKLMEKWLRDGQRLRSVTCYESSIGTREIVVDLEIDDDHFGSGVASNLEGAMRAALNKS